MKVICFHNPDEENGFGYLEAIKKALDGTGEFPQFDDQQSLSLSQNAKLLN